MTDSHQRCSSGTNTLRLIAEELREYTAMKYAGDCKCGKCQLVPRELVERLYHTLNSAGVTPSVAQAEQQPVAWRWRARSWENHWIYNPSPEWRALRQSDPELEFQPLFASVVPSTHEPAQPSPRDYTHGKLYVYDAESQTFDEAAPDAQLEAAREFIKRHPALSLIDLAEFEAFLKMGAALSSTHEPAMQALADQAQAEDMGYSAPLSNRGGGA